jgi:probable O-glycosylation ligase (exosortase A-associated)
MRDAILISLVLLGSLTALRYPWVGIMLWTWLSIMNPHRYTWGFAYSAPLAAIAAVCVALGWLMTQERESPFKGTPVTFFVIFMGWITLSWLVGLDVAGDYDAWKNIMKIDVMLLVALTLLHSKQHIFALMWVCTGSLALLGIKGGIFTLTSGASNRVWGPPGSFIEDNNAFALALVMTIPLLRFLHLQAPQRWVRFGLVAAMLLCAAAALGSYSRGALLAISAMALTLWWRGGNKLRTGFVFLVIAAPLLVFMPDEWAVRMGTIKTYEFDGSAMGRIGAWKNSWGIAWYYLTGVGFNTATPELFARFSPNAEAILVAHSNYFQVMGNHGFIGLVLYLSIWVSTWRTAGWLRQQTQRVPQTQWTADLGAMCQVSLVGYLVGGAFLNLAYFDLPYNLMVMVVLTRVWVEKKSWKTEPICPPGWRTLPGLALPAQAA